MPSLTDYLRDPCGTLSIPYWKQMRLRMPENMQVLHQRDFDEALLETHTDEAYFRLLHTLERVNPAVPDWLCLRTASAADIPLMAEIINASYTNLSVTAEQLESYRHSDVFSEDLWLIAFDRPSSRPVGCGIAELDGHTGEGALEWIQVLPEFRRRHAGRAIVGQLLHGLRGRADFVTVSGRVSDASCPEKLYRACGFTGSDVWHILKAK